MLALSNHKMQNACFPQLTYMCFYIYTGSFLRLRPGPAPRGATSRSRPRCLPRGSESGTGRPGRPPRTGWEGPRLSSGASGSTGHQQGQALRTPHPPTGCRPCATPGPRGPPQRPAATAEGRGESHVVSPPATATKPKSQHLELQWGML